MLGFSRFYRLLFSVSLLIGCQSQLALSQGFSRLEPEVIAPQAPVRPILRTGSQGNVVSELQAALKLLGYYTGAVDGNYSESTAIAVSQFQQAAGLRPDGVVGPATWNQLFPLTPTTAPARTSASTATSTNSTANSSTTTNNSNPRSTVSLESSSEDLPILRLGMRGPEVFWLQKRLQTAGLFRGSVDGIFGPETEIAVKAAQSRFGLNSDGIVGATTWRALLR